MLILINNKRLVHNFFLVQAEEKEEQKLANEQNLTTKNFPYNIAKLQILV